MLRLKKTKWRFPKTGVPPNQSKSSILIGFFPLNRPSIGYPHSRKHPGAGNGWGLHGDACSHSNCKTQRQRCGEAWARSRPMSKAVAEIGWIPPLEISSIWFYIVLVLIGFVIGLFAGVYDLMTFPNWILVYSGLFLFIWLYIIGCIAPNWVSWNGETTVLWMVGELNCQKYPHGWKVMIRCDKWVYLHYTMVYPYLPICSEFQFNSLPVDTRGSNWSRIAWARLGCRGCGCLGVGGARSSSSGRTGRKRPNWHWLTQVDID